MDEDTTSSERGGVRTKAEQAKTRMAELSLLMLLLLTVSERGVSRNAA